MLGGNRLKCSKVSDGLISFNDRYITLYNEKLAADTTIIAILKENSSGRGYIFNRVRLFTVVEN